MARETTSRGARAQSPRRNAATRLPNWAAWLTEIAKSVAVSSDDYQLALAAWEWALTAPLDVNTADEFR